MKVNVLGRVRNTFLPKSQSLLPIFEAVVNSIHSIEDLRIRDGEIKIYIERDFSQENLSLSGDSILPIRDIIVEDNGQGFNDTNFNSFETSDSSLKQDKGSKGVGRFMWLKAFDEVYVESIFYEIGDFKRREFIFELSDDGIRDHKLEGCLERTAKTRVHLRNLKNEFKDSFPKNTITIANKILEHILIFFITDNAPQITIFDGPEIVNLNDIYRNQFESQIEKVAVSFNSLNFDINFLKADATHEGKHSLSMCAHGREVKSIKLEKYGADFSKKFEENDKKFVLLVYISGEVLDRNVNQERTNFNIPEESSESYGIISMENIVDLGVARTKEFAKIYTEKIKAERIETYVISEGPRAARGRWLAA